MEITQAADGIIGMTPLPMATTAVAGVNGIRLADLATGASARVLSVHSPEGAEGPSDVQRRLAELGFLPGETIRIVARGFLGKEPLAVRIGTGTFALRMFEAAWVRVSPELTQPR